MERFRLSALQKESQRCSSPERLNPKRILRRVRWRKDCAVIFSHFSAAEVFYSTFFQKKWNTQLWTSEICILRRAKFSMLNEQCLIENENNFYASYLELNDFINQKRNPLRNDQPFYV